MKTIRTAIDLVEAGFIEPEMLPEIEKVTEKFSVSLTPQLIEILNTGSEADQQAIRKQFIPSPEELITTRSELKDPIGDTPHTQVKGVVHRNKDRCLLMPINTCPVYCRFCFRREVVGKKTNALTEVELENAYAYIEEHKEIWEVILTGGDPLFLKPQKIRKIFKALEQIQHVEVVRIHARVPVVDSGRITPDMIQALKIDKAVYVAIHANHPSEFTDQVKVAIAQFVDAGIPLLSQTVLLKGVNDTVEVMGELMRTFVKNRIKPYYLHHGDLAEGTSHFRTTVKQGQDLMKALRSRYSGLCQPTYVLDIPGGFGKVPVSCHQYFSQQECADPAHESFEIEDYQGQIHSYKS